MFKEFELTHKSDPLNSCLKINYLQSMISHLNITHKIRRKKKSLNLNNNIANIRNTNSLSSI